MTQQPNTRQLIVTELKELSTGTGNNGQPYVLYQVRATYPDGRVIPDMKLRTFEQLPTNEVIHVRIEAHHSDKYGDSYTLFQVGGGKAAGQALVERVEALERKVAHMAGLLGASGESAHAPLEPVASGRSSGARPQNPIGPPMPTGETPPTPPTDGGQGANGDIPF